MQRIFSVFWLILIFAAGTPLASGLEVAPASDRCLPEAVRSASMFASNTADLPGVYRLQSGTTSSGRIQDNKHHHSCERHQPVAAAPLAVLNHNRKRIHVSGVTSLPDLDFTGRQVVAIHPSGSATSGLSSPLLYLHKMVFRL